VESALSQLQEKLAPVASMSQLQEKLAAPRQASSTAKTIDSKLAASEHTVQPNVAPKVEAEFASTQRGRLFASDRNELGEHYLELLKTHVEARKASKVEGRPDHSKRSMSDLQSKQTPKTKSGKPFHPIDTVIAGYHRSIKRMEDILLKTDARNAKVGVRNTLGGLYHRLGKTFSEASDLECTQLVRDSKSLLLIDGNRPAKDIILENAISALRTSLEYRPGMTEVESTLSQLEEKLAPTCQLAASDRSPVCSIAEASNPNMAARQGRRDGLGDFYVSELEALKASKMNRMREAHNMKDEL